MVEAVKDWEQHYKEGLQSRDLAGAEKGKDLAACLGIVAGNIMDDLAVVVSPQMRHKMREKAMDAALRAAAKSGECNPTRRRMLELVRLWQPYLRKFIILDVVTQRLDKAVHGSFGEAVAAIEEDGSGAR